MGTKHIARNRKDQASRPGGLAMRANKYAKLALLAFFLLCGAGVGLMIAEISTPGMAWYVYE